VSLRALPPGLKEITALQEELMRIPMFNREPAASWVLPLHSTVPPEDQRKVLQHFLRQPAPLGPEH